MGHSRGPPDAREWHFRALGALESHSPRYGRPRLQRPLLDAIGADPRASKPAELSSAAPKPGTPRAPCPRAAGASEARPGNPRGAQPVPPQLSLHGPLLVAFKVQLHKTKPTELPVGAPMSGALRAPFSRAASTSQARFRSPGARVAHSPRLAARASRAAARRYLPRFPRSKSLRAVRFCADVVAGTVFFHVGSASGFTN